MADLTLYDWFARSASRHPDALALRVGDTSLTYRALRAASDAVVTQLANHGVVRVGLVATRTPFTYAAYLAALRTGAAVVPLNPAFPPERNETICADADLSLVLVDREHQDAVPPRLRFRALHGDRDESRAAPDRRTEMPRPELADLAYILFTSGSTGHPKGLPIRHRNVSQYVSHMIERYQVGPGCRLTQTFDLTFDPSVFDMFVAWGSGAAVVVPGRDDLGDPPEFVRRNEITHWFSVPSIVSLAVRMRRLVPDCMPGLRWSLFAGEQLTLEQARHWSAAAPNSTIENLYGPTELTVTCTAYRLPRDRASWPVTGNGTVPIGDCYPHLEHVVLDRDGRPDVEGELCVRGPQRFGGYLDESNNAGRFVAFDPATDEPARTCRDVGPVPDDLWYRTGDRVSVRSDCTMVHLGRLDSQVQIHGYRVELGEIEAHLRQHPNVREAALTVRDAELRAVYTGEPTGADELARWLRDRLPPYMVPRNYACLDALPLNHNGKLDRKKLETMPC